MLLKVYVSGTGTAEERMEAINRQVQKVNEELSRLRLMIDSMPTLEMDLREEKKLSAATDSNEPRGESEAQKDLVSI